MSLVYNVVYTLLGKASTVCVDSFHRKMDAEEHIVLLRRLQAENISPVKTCFVKEPPRFDFGECKHHDWERDDEDRGVCQRCGEVDC